MLSVKEAAVHLRVSEQRVRAMIYEGVLPAQRNGMKWLLVEQPVFERARNTPKAGRPPKSVGQYASQSFSHKKTADDAAQARELYRRCKKQLFGRYGYDLLSAARTPEERGFYTVVADYFLQCKQTELIERGVF